ncbi:NAD(P)-binding protein [Ascobolus immersus RN42]|uniref:2,4-dienoyl-CoA reductase [(3E)-enoyl-CoA-producing] n=1 Tax=Ascobolus immersus RN42 TaxID=1160509 RepID=A0A3N4HPR3_ASCIM|nr:NAD(P)-binding protein [Ascobolus immersus RN42]
MVKQYVSKNTWAPGIFDGKVVFCTGGAGDICSGQVEALVSLGANAVILGRRQEATQKRASEIAAIRPGAQVLGLGGIDVRSVQALEGAVATTIEKLGRIDFVICGAAGNFLSTVENLSANAFKSVIDIDLLGSYNTVKATLAEVKKRKGRYLFVSATMHYTGMPYQSHAIAAKAAIDALSGALSIELGPYGVTSNTLAPGPIAGTEGMARLAQASQLDKLTRNIPLQRMGEVSDIADATVFLFSPAANWITGTGIVVDGGAWRRQSNHEPYPEIVMSGEPVADVAGQKGKHLQRAKL